MVLEAMHTTGARKYTQSALGVDLLHTCGMSVLTNVSGTALSITTNFIVRLW